VLEDSFSDSIDSTGFGRRTKRPSSKKFNATDPQLEDFEEKLNEFNEF